MNYRKLTKAERVVRKAKAYGAEEAWYFIGKGTTDFYVHIPGKVIRVSVGTRYLRGAINQMDQQEFMRGK